MFVFFMSIDVKSVFNHIPVGNPIRFEENNLFVSLE